MIRLFKGLLVILGIALLGLLGTLGWQVYVSDLRAEPLVGVITDTQRLVPFKGRHLRDSLLYVYTLSGSIPEQDMIALRASAGNALQRTMDVKAVPDTSQAVFAGIYQPQYMTVDLSPVWEMLRNGDRLRFKFVRASIFRPLLPDWMTYRCRTEVEVSGSLLPVSVEQERASRQEPFPMLYHLFKPRFKLGEVVRLPGLKYGTTRGTVSIDDKSIPILHWTDTEIIFRIPEKSKPGESIVCTITSKDDRTHRFLAAIEAPPVPVPTTPQLDKAAWSTVTAGQSVRVTGSEFGKPGKVTFGDRLASIDFWSDRAVAFTVPEKVSPGLCKVVITRADKQSVSFYARMKEPVVETPEPDAVMSLLQGYRKLQTGDDKGARADFDGALELTEETSTEGIAVRAIIRLMNNAEDAEAEQMARKATRLAKTTRERGLAYLATGWNLNRRQDWTTAKGLDDPQIKALAEALLGDLPDTNNR